MRSMERIFRDTIAVKERVLQDRTLLDAADAVADAMIATYRSGGRVYFCGNGGSAADAQHFAAELSGHFIFDRPPLAAEALHGNASHMTAVANDYDYESVFARALTGSARRGDLLVAISTSGDSASIVRAAEAARVHGVSVVAMTGAGGGALAALADIALRIPSNETGRIQESHIVFVHAISERVEHVLFADEYKLPAERPCAFESADVAALPRP
ncbi:SIS domain-containing protein [Curtobacterium sp. C2H10]|jgi:D-sedoheptulose 7-phosphate isomerase|nr:SIS domain-containing protein [Curtobacterium sp. C2H10]